MAAGCRLYRDASGVAAVEFALVAPVFFLLVYLIIDSGLQLFTQAILDNAVREAARPILTGSSAVTASSFDGILCTKAAPLIPCTKLSFVVTSTKAVNGFSSLATVSPNSSGYFTCTSANLGSCAFSAGAATDLVLVQVAYSRPYLFPAIGNIMGGTGTPSLVTTLPIANEAY